MVNCSEIITEEQTYVKTLSEKLTGLPEVAQEGIFKLTDIKFIPLDLW